MWNKGGGYPYRNDPFSDKVRQIIDFQRSCREFKKDLYLLKSSIFKSLFQRRQLLIEVLRNLLKTLKGE